jgi:hypothetical protein
MEACGRSSGAEVWAKVLRPCVPNESLVVGYKKALVVARDCVEETLTQLLD